MCIRDRYEWARDAKPKIPYYIRETHRQAFAFAALWDQWRVDEGVSLLSATILTQDAPDDIFHIHHRAGVRLPESQWDNWLNWDIKADKILDAKKNGDDLEYYEVDDVVNSGGAQGPDLILPA